MLSFCCLSTHGAIVVVPVVVVVLIAFVAELIAIVDVGVDIAIDCIERDNNNGCCK